MYIYLILVIYFYLGAIKNLYIIMTKFVNIFEINIPYIFKKVGDSMKTSENTNSKINRNMREEFYKPPYPFYGVGLFWLIYAFILPMYRWFDFVIVGILSFIIYFLIKKITPEKSVIVPIKEKPIESGNSDVDAIINSGVYYLHEISYANDKISDPKLSAEILRMEKATEKIFRYIGEYPKDAPEIRKFMNYYLPTLLKLLNSYISLSEQSIPGNNINKTLTNIEGILSTIADAFEKQLDNLFANVALDISTDITVLETMLAQEGLTDKNSFK